MGLPKKKNRQIKIGSATYRYMVSGNDDFINLIIELDAVKGQRFIATFDYHHLETSGKTSTGEEVIALTQRNQITPSVVREVIEYGRKNGWQPEEPGREFRMNVIVDAIQLILVDPSEKG